MFRMEVNFLIFVEFMFRFFLLAFKIRTLTDSIGCKIVRYSYWSHLSLWRGISVRVHYFCFIFGFNEGIVFLLRGRVFVLSQYDMTDSKFNRQSGIDCYSKTIKKSLKIPKG
jgi:hypothetical protein